MLLHGQVGRVIGQINIYQSNFYLGVSQSRHQVFQMMYAMVATCLGIVFLTA